MAGNAGQGRPKGARNRRTAELLALADSGETPVEFGLKIMRDETKDLTTRLHAARFVVPYLHPRPAPAGEVVNFDLPEAANLQSVTAAMAAVLKAVSQGQMPVNTGRDLVAMIDVQRKSIELLEIEKRIEALEKARRD
jgi:hypothetical protein